MLFHPFTPKKKKNYNESIVTKSAFIFLKALLVRALSNFFFFKKILEILNYKYFLNPSCSPHYMKWIASLSLKPTSFPEHDGSPKFFLEIEVFLLDWFLKLSEDMFFKHVFTWGTQYEIRVTKYVYVELIKRITKNVW